MRDLAFGLRLLRNQPAYVPLDRALSQSLGMNATRESKVQAATQIVGIVDDVKQEGADGVVEAGLQTRPCRRRD